MVSRKVGILVCILLGAFALAAPPDLSSPKATLKSFLAALNACDMKRAAACVRGGAVDFDWGPFEKELKKNRSTGAVSKIVVNVAGNKATIHFLSLILNSNPSVGPQSNDETMTLRKIGGKWLIAPMGRPLPGEHPQGLCVAAYAVAHPNEIGGESTSADDASPAPAPGYSGSPAEDCQTNVKQLCIACRVFASDNGGSFKIDPAKVHTQLLPYVRSKAVFVCQSASGGPLEYAINTDLAGADFAAIGKPAQTVLVYEGAKGKLIFKHDGRATVGFVDGHVERVDQEGAKRLRWTP